MRNAVSIVVIGGQVADDVSGLVTDWTRAGITESSLWVRPADIVESEGQPARVSAQLVGPDGCESVDLFAYIARFRLDVVRVVVAQLVASADDGDAELSRLGGVLADAVTAVLPLSPTGQQTARLHRSVVVIPTSGAHGVSREILQPRWEANVVVSPEDRSDLDRASVFVRADENFVGHAAAAVVAAAGVVRGIPDGALDGVTSDSSARPDDVVVARVSIRSVVGDDVLDLIQARTLDPATLAGVGPVAVVDWAAASHDPDNAAGDLVAALTDHELWRATDAPERERLVRPREGFSDAVGRAARFNAQTAGAVLAWTARRGRRRIERSATERIVGSGSGSMVTIGPLAADRAEELAIDALESDRRALEDAPAADRTRITAPSPATWEVYRRLLLASADGGRLELIEEPRHLGEREVLSPTHLSPDPAHAFTTSTGAVIEPFDAVSIDQVGASMRATATEAAEVAQRTEVERNRARDAAGQARAAADAATEQAAASAAPAEAGAVTPEQPDDGEEDGRGPARAASDGSAEAEALAAAAARLGAEVVRLEAALLEAIEAREHADGELARFRDWAQPVRATVAHRLGDVLRRRLYDQEADERHANETAVASTAPATSALDRAKGALLRRWWVTWLVLAVVVGGAWAWAYLISEDPDRFRVAAIISVITPIMALVALICINHAFYKSFRQYEWGIQSALADQRHFYERRAWVRQEVVRTRILLSGWFDWTRIISEVLHRTWHPVSTQYESLNDDVVDQLPAAMAVGRQEDDGIEGIPQGVFVAAYRVNYPPGWAQQAFDDAYAMFRERLAVQESKTFLEVDADIRPSPISPRTQLVEYWKNGEGRRDLGESRANRLRELVQDGDLTIPHRIVRRLGRYSDGYSVSELDFFLPTHTSSTTFALDAFRASARAKSLHYVKTTRAWLPPLATDARPGGSALTRVQASSTSTALRVDISRRLDPGELEVFATATGRSVAATTEAHDPDDDFL